MRFAKEFLHELESQADIVKIVGDYVALKKKGANYWAPCPFHNEKTPSFSVSPKGFFKCFGCGKGGSVFNFIMEIEGSSFPEAVETVAEKSGIALPAPVAANDSHEQDELETLRNDIRQLHVWAGEFFERSLDSVDGRQAREYLDRRGVTAETRRQFKLGFAPESWDALSGYLMKRGASRYQVERSGLVSIRESGSGFYDRFRGRLMFPILDAQGRLLAFGGRILGDGEPKYLNSPETALYQKGRHLYGLYHSREMIRRTGTVILVEGYLDFLIPFQEGVRNLVASLGTALGEKQVKLLGRFARKVVVNFDPDSAGVNATKRSLELFLSEGLKVSVMTLPDNLDPDEFIRTRGVEAYQGYLNKAESFMDYVVGQAIKGHNQNTPTGKVETLNEILPYLKLVRNRIELTEQVHRIADRLKLDAQQIREEFRRAAESGVTEVSEQLVRPTLVVRPAEKSLLAAILSNPMVRRRILHQLSEDEISGLRTGSIFSLLVEFDEEGIEPNFGALAGRIEDPGLVNEFLPALLLEADPDRDEAVIQAAADDSLVSLRSSLLAEQQARIQLELNHAQREGMTDRANELLLEKFELAKRERALANQNKR